MLRSSFASLLTLLFAAHPASAQLMDSALERRLDAALPTLSQIIADDALHGRLPGRRLFYTGNEIVHSHQRESGDFVTSNRNVAARPDGFPSTGFEFPWKNPGGTDESHVFAWKIMFLPGDAKVQVFRTTLPGFFDNAKNPAGWDWEFPVGTRFFELLSFGDRLVVFEVRSRTKVAAGKWRVNVYRPFPTRDSFAEAVNDLPSSPVWMKRTISDRNFHRNRAAFNDVFFVEYAPSFPTPDERDRMLNRPFTSAFGRGWTDDCAAPTATTDNAIVPKGYNGVIVGVTADSCMKCHADAAQHVRTFDANREWYQFVRGSLSEKILSFHPISEKSLNGGTIRLNEKLVAAGMVDWRRK